MGDKTIPQNHYFRQSSYKLTRPNCPVRVRVASLIKEAGRKPAEERRPGSWDDLRRRLAVAILKQMPGRQVNIPRLFQMFQRRCRDCPAAWGPLDKTQPEQKRLDFIFQRIGRDIHAMSDRL